MKVSPIFMKIQNCRKKESQQISMKMWKYFQNIKKIQNLKSENTTIQKKHKKATYERNVTKNEISVSEKAAFFDKKLEKQQISGKFKP